ncbi:hypothetical protein MIND_00314300 [Mycena indigotica]|uniref:Uncharacterized protein n=1 Tax=Mycena indigotica TaxID=2126181 RepID=A0A8H6T228_9AGAR|nr:uncharacterized protein MIND_00314300 [Mycena indigotica]KAF7309435.1 hypothetical protein MIND_00314300 [Mycena indigotica]
MFAREPPFVAQDPFTRPIPWPFTWKHRRKAEPTDIRVEHRPTNVESVSQHFAPDGFWEKRRVAVARLKRAASLPRMKDGRRLPFYHRAPVAEEEGAEAEESKEQYLPAESSWVVSYAVQPPAGYVESHQVPNDNIGFIPSQAFENQRPTTGKWPSLEQGQVHAELFARHLADGVEAEANAPSKLHENVTSASHAIDDTENNASTQLATAIMRSSTPDTPPQSQARGNSLPSLQDLQHGLFKSNIASGSTSASRTMAMHQLTGGPEAHDPSVPHGNLRLGRNRTVSGEERTTARELMLNRLGGRITRESVAEYKQVSVPNPGSRKRRSHAGVGANVSALNVNEQEEPLHDAMASNSDDDDDDDDDEIVLFRSDTPPTQPPRMLSLIREDSRSSTSSTVSTSSASISSVEKDRAFTASDSLFEITVIPPSPIGSSDWVSSGSSIASPPTYNGSSYGLGDANPQTQPGPAHVIQPPHRLTPLRRRTSLPLPVTQRPPKHNIHTLQNVVFFAAFVFFDFVPRHAYMHFLLRIPALYFSRVARIFEDAQLTLPDIKRMARAKAAQWHMDTATAHGDMVVPRTTTESDDTPLPRSLLLFRASWEGFIDTLVREWKTFNVISVLLMSAILTLLQIDGSSHPITRTTALFSLICALMSLLYGCMFIIRFGTMRKMHKASGLAQEAQNGKANIWWNIWVLLAMPAIWLSWSIITFLASIMSFVWLAGSSADTIVLLSPRAALGPRIGLSFVFALGLLYFCMIVREFHKFGDPLDREWTRVVNEWAAEPAKEGMSDKRELSTNSDQPQSIRRHLGQHSEQVVNKTTVHLQKPFNRSVPTQVMPETSSYVKESSLSNAAIPHGSPLLTDTMADSASDAKWSQSPVKQEEWDRFRLDISSASSQYRGVIQVSARPQISYSKQESRPSETNPTRFQPLALFAASASSSDTNPQNHALRVDQSELQVTLPSELIETILDELRDDHTTLKSCSIAASALCTPSQRHLFRSIWVHRANWQYYTVGQQALHRGVSTPSGTIRQAAAVLSDSPHLALYVKDLTIDLPDSANEDAPLARILKAVGANLGRFVISGLVVRWSDLSPSLASALVDTLASQNLCSLHLLSVRGLPLESLRRAIKTIAALSIHASTFSSESPNTSDNKEPHQRSLSPITHLILTTGLLEMYDIILSPNGPVLANISKLFLRVDPTVGLNADRLLKVVAGTLQELTLDCGESAQPVYLPDLPHLRALTLRLFRGIARRLPMGLIDTLSDLPSVDLTLIFVLETRITEPPWDSEQVVIPSPTFDLGKAHFRALFLSGSEAIGRGRATRSRWKDLAFEQFRKAMLLAFGHYTTDQGLDVERIEEGPYVTRLP